MIRPYYEEDGIVIYHADCRDVLNQLPPCFRVDGLVTDPPFGIGFTYQSHDDTADGYQAFVWGVIEKAESFLNPGSPVFVWQAMQNLKRFGEWFPRDWRLFSAAKSFVQMRPTAMQWAVDPVLVWWTDGAKPWSDGTSTRDFHVAQNAGTIASKTWEKGHPCPRPLDQVEHIVAQWVKPGATILDTFMGSGTTLVAAKRLGRKAIGIEIEERYCEIAVKRLAQGALPLEMTVEESRHLLAQYHAAADDDDPDR